MKNLKLPLITLAIALVSTLVVQGFTKQATTLKASDHLRKSLNAANKIEVYEGLPHQRWERETLKKEKQRSDTTKVATFPFYTPKVTATPAQASALKKLLSNTKHYRPFSGEKLCGGFHPDYAVAWTKEGKEHSILLCFGCSEVLFVDDKATYLLDFKAVEEAQKLLKQFEKKRPKSQLTD